MRIRTLVVVSLVVASLVVSSLVVTSSPTPSPPQTSDRVTASSQSRNRVVWVALEAAGEIVKVDVSSQTVIARRAVPGQPHNLNISPSGTTVATSLWSGDSVVVRHEGSQSVVNLGGAPHDVKIGSGRVVVTNQTEARLDLVTRQGRFVRSIRLKADPHDLALRWKGRQAWATLDDNDDLAVVSIRSGNVRHVSTRKAPHDILFAPDGKLWVSDWNGAIHVFSKKGRRLKTIPLGVEAHHLAFTPDGDQVWITDHAAHRVFVVRTETYRVIKRFEVAGAPHHIAITSDGDRAVVADHERGLLIVYNVDKLYRATTIRVGAGPHGIWAMP